MAAPLSRSSASTRISSEKIGLFGQNGCPIFKLIYR